MKPIIPPQNLSELLERANMMAGISLAQIAAHRGIAVPKDLKQIGRAHV